MRTSERHWLAAILVATACASTSPRRDFSRVADLARVPLPPPSAAPTDGSPPPEVRELLAAPLTADSAVRIALLQNPELRAALLDVAAARGRAAQTATLPNPAFEVDVRSSTDRAQPLQNDFFVEYDLTRALLAPLRASVGEAEVEVARIRAAAAAIELGYRVRAAFYRWQGAQQRLETANRALDALAAGRDAARALFRAGNVTELDLLSREAAYESGRATSAESELAALETREALQRVLGLHGEASAWSATAKFADPEEPPGPGDVEARAVAASLALAETRARLEAIARRTGLARAEGWIPEVTVDAHVERDDREWERGGGARFSIPLFDRRQGALAAHEAEFDALAARHQATAVAIRSSARESRDRLLSAYRRARHYREIVVPARRRVVEHAVRQLNAMAINVFELLRFQREQLESELAASDALRDYWIARAAFDALAAGHEPGIAAPRPAPSAPLEGY